MKLQLHNRSEYLFTYSLSGQPSSSLLEGKLTLQVVSKQKKDNRVFMSAEYLWITSPIYSQNQGVAGEESYGHHPFIGPTDLHIWLFFGGPEVLHNLRW